jgi:putative peptidoglycan lipid II flippase
VALAVLAAPVLVFTLARQSQVLLERFFAASLAPGAISHLNYAQKIAQIPMVASLMICTVTFPAVSRALAAGDRAKARVRVERDLALACVVVLVGAAYVIACAPRIVGLLFQRGRFDAADTAATASVMRVYALGLLGQSLVGALVRPYFSARRPAWYPAAAMAAGLAVTAAVDAAGVRLWGVHGIAAGNAAGITVTAALLLRALGAHTVAVRLRVMAPLLGRALLAAAAATAAGWALADAVHNPPAAAGACAVAVPAVFAATMRATRHRVPLRPPRPRGGPAAHRAGGLTGRSEARR